MTPDISKETERLIQSAAAQIYDKFRQDPEVALKIVREPLTLKGWVAKEEQGTVWMSFPVDMRLLGRVRPRQSLSIS